MIKTLSYFPKHTALNSGPAMNALLDSARSSGIQLCENSMDADAAVVWSVLWHGRMQPNHAVYTHYRNAGKPVIIVEVGSLRRNQTWKIAMNNITANGYYGHLDNLDWDRPRKLNIKLSSPTQSTGEIIVALQHARSLQVQAIDIVQWAMDTVSELKKHTDRPVVVRPHPRSRVNLPPGIKTVAPKKLENTYDSYDMQFNCHAVVNYNSGVGIQSAICGVRPIVDASSLAAPVSITVDSIERSYTIDRDLWLTQICHTEYTVEEIQNGLWLKRLKINQQ